MDVMKNLRILETKVTDLESKNNSRSTTFYSLQLVLNELQSEYERLKVEELERKHRLDAVKKVEGQIHELLELNKNLIKFVLEQRASLPQFQIIRQNHQFSSIESNISFQKSIQEKLQEIKESHSNIKIVKRHSELQRTEHQLNQELEKLNKVYNNEERDFETATAGFNQKISQKIVKLIVKAKYNSQHHTLKEDKAGEVCKLSVASSASDLIPTPKIVRQSITIGKLSDFKLPEIPTSLRGSHQINELGVVEILPSLKRDIQQSFICGKDTRKRSFRSILPQKQSHQISSSTMQYNDSVSESSAKIEIENSNRSTSALAKVQRLEQNQLAGIQATSSDFQRIQNCFKHNPNVNLVLQQTSETIKVQSVRNSPPELSSTYSKDTRSLTIESQSVDLKCSESQAQVEERKKIFVVSNIVIKEGVDESHAMKADMSSMQSVKSQNITNEETISENRITKCSPVDMNKEVSKGNLPSRESSLQNCTNNKSTTQLLKTYVKNGTESRSHNIVGTKSASLNNAKGVSAQSLQTNTIDLSSELPSSHITINSSNKSREGIESSGKISPSASPSGSVNFLNDFLTDFSVGISPTQKGGTKRKGSDDAASFAGGLDFGSFDFSKKSKMGSPEVADDFFQNLCGAPAGEEGGDKDGTMFNFDEFMSFK